MFQQKFAFDLARNFPVVGESSFHRPSLCSSFLRLASDNLVAVNPHAGSFLPLWILKWWDKHSGREMFKIAQRNPSVRAGRAYSSG